MKSQKEDKMTDTRLDTWLKIVLGIFGLLLFGLFIGFLFLLATTLVGVPLIISAALGALIAASFCGILSGGPTVIDNYRESFRKNSYKDVLNMAIGAWQRNFESISVNNIKSKDPDSKVLSIIRFLDRWFYTITVIVFGFIVTLIVSIIQMFTLLVFRIAAYLGHVIWTKNCNNSTYQNISVDLDFDERDVSDNK